MIAVAMLDIRDSETPHQWISIIHMHKTTIDLPALSSVKVATHHALTASVAKKALVAIAESTAPRSEYVTAHTYDHPCFVLLLADIRRSVATSNLQ